MNNPRIDESASVAVSSSPARDQTPVGPNLDARVRKRLGTESPEFALDVTFQASPGFTILFGPSGAGKTTLLDCVAGLARPDSGRIAIGDRIWFDAAHSTDLPVAQRRVGYVFQALALFPHLTVEQNVQYGLTHLPQAQRAAQASAILQAFRIPHLAPRYPREISGGESQRTALARTLVTNPALLLLDEPLAALDASTKTTIIDDLRSWNQAHRIPILYVTHSREEVFALGERVIVLDAGRIVAQGTPHEVISAPLQETSRSVGRFRKHVRRRGGVGKSGAGDDVLPHRECLRTSSARNSARAWRSGLGTAGRNPSGRHSASDGATSRFERAECDSGARQGSDTARRNRHRTCEV